MTYGLILIDIQQDYLPGGSHEVPGAKAAAQKAAQLLGLFREKEWPVFHVQHIADVSAPFFRPNTPGAQFYPLTAPLESERSFIKHTPDSFFETGLAEALQKAGVDKLVVCGMMTQMCVDTTVRAARPRRLPVELIADACAADSLSWNGEQLPATLVQAVYLASLSGSFAQVRQTQEFLAEHQ